MSLLNKYTNFMPIIGFPPVFKFPCHFKRLQIYGLIEKGAVSLFTMQFFYSLPHDGSFLSMEHHPMAAHSGDTQIASTIDYLEESCYRRKYAPLPQGL
jgi:hypothetical protein